MQTSAPENLSATEVAVESNTGDLLLNIDDMLSSFAPQESVDTLLSINTRKSKEKSKPPRFRVKWHADIIFEDQSTDHGYINDISEQGTSICLNSSLHTMKCMLRIHVPPLNIKCSTRFIEVTGKLVYLVYDSNQQLFRAAISFMKFNFESDLAYLNERLTKHQVTIPELT